MRISRFFRGLAMIAPLLFAAPLFAADETSDFEGVPAYSVTRLRIYEGSAWIRTPDSGDWEEFPTNSPVPARSLVSIPDGSEAELQFHGGQFVLLTSGTEISVRGMEEDRTVFRVRSGEVRFYLPEADFAPVRVVTPDGRTADFNLPGRYWMTASDGGSTLIVRQGEGIVTAESGEIPVKAGEEAIIGEDVLVREYRGDGKDFREDLPPLTEAEREAGVPPAAAEELRDYGEWVSSEEYGYVWRPRVAEGWSPYYYGQWYWISPYGWTWLSYEPWGWYPYHYGYWYTDPVFGWVWSPYRTFFSVSFVFGHHDYYHFHRRAHFHPANVRFVRDGTRVRWIPLRPGERTRRISFTRSDRRLASWERPLERGTVFVRGDGRNGSGWRDWTAVRRERRNAAGISGSPARRDSGRVERIVPREGTSSRERAVERGGRGGGERPGAITRGRVPSPNQGQRISPPSSRPGGRSRSYPRENRLRPGIAERNGSPGRRSGVSPARPAVPDRAERYGIRDSGKRYGDRGRERVRPSGPAVRQTGRNAFGTNRQRVAAPRQGRTVTAPRGRQSVEASRGRGRINGRFLGRGAERPAPPAIDRAGGRFRGSRSIPQGRSGGSFGRGLRFEGNRGFIGSGFRGGARGRSVR